MLTAQVGPSEKHIEEMKKETKVKEKKKKK